MNEAQYKALDQDKELCNEEEMALYTELEKQFIFEQIYFESDYRITSAQSAFEAMRAMIEGI